MDCVFLFETMTENRPPCRIEQDSSDFSMDDSVPHSTLKFETRESTILNIADLVPIDDFEGGYINETKP